MDGGEWRSSSRPAAPGLSAHPGIRTRDLDDYDAELDDDDYSEEEEIDGRGEGERGHWRGEEEEDLREPDLYSPPLHDPKHKPHSPNFFAVKPAPTSPNPLLDLQSLNVSLFDDDSSRDAFRKGILGMAPNSDPESPPKQQGNRQPFPEPSRSPVAFDFGRGSRTAPGAATALGAAPGAAASPSRGSGMGRGSLRRAEESWNSEELYPENDAESDEFETAKLRAPPGHPSRDATLLLHHRQERQQPAQQQQQSRNHSSSTDEDGKEAEEYSPNRAAQFGGRRRSEDMPGGSRGLDGPLSRDSSGGAPGVSRALEQPISRVSSAGVPGSGRGYDQQPIPRISSSAVPGGSRGLEQPRILPHGTGAERPRGAGGGSVAPALGRRDSGGSTSSAGGGVIGYGRSTLSREESGIIFAAMGGDDDANGGEEFAPREIVRSGQAAELLVQIEAMIASGPHGKLDEYLPIVSLLLSMRKLLSDARDESGMAQAEKLFKTAMEDLEYEFRDILKFRSARASEKLTPEELLRLFRVNFIEARATASTAATRTSSSAESEASGAFSGSGPGCAGDDMAEDDTADADAVLAEPAPDLPELLPASSVKWLNEAAHAMLEGGADEQSITAYRTVRAEALKETIASLKIDEKLRVPSIPAMPWSELERATKEWVQHAYTVGVVLLRMERQLAAAAWQGLETQRRGALRRVLLDSGLCLKMLFLVEALRAIVARSMAEQLFSLLDAYQVIEKIMDEMELTFGDLRLDAVWDIWQGLPSLVARAIANAFDRCRQHLENIQLPENVGSASNPSSSTPKKSSRSLSKRLLMPLASSSTSDHKDEDDPTIYDYVPRYAEVDSITSYVANYIRSYMERQGPRSYVATLQELFHLLDDDEPPYNGRSMEGETAHLVTALRANLEARSKLYKDEATQQLFLMNNFNYLVKSLAQWHGWNARNLNKVRSKTRREGVTSLMVSIADLQDNRIVLQHAGAMQSLALLKIMTLLTGDLATAEENTAHAGSDKTSVRQEIARLKRFTAAFDELRRRQHQQWRITDEDLRTLMRGKWATMLKERYRKSLLPFWEELTGSKHYVYSPEQVESIITETFFADAPEPTSSSPR